MSRTQNILLGVVSSLVTAGAIASGFVSFDSFSKQEALNKKREEKQTADMKRSFLMEDPNSKVIDSQLLEEMHLALKYVAESEATMRKEIENINANCGKSCEEPYQGSDCHHYQSAKLISERWEKRIWKDSYEECVKDPNVAKACYLHFVHNRSQSIDELAYVTSRLDYLKENGSDYPNSAIPVEREEYFRRYKAHRRSFENSRDSTPRPKQ